MISELPIISSNSFQKSQFSKWQKIQLLLDPIEMELLLRHLFPIHILDVSGVVPWEKISITTEEFMHVYRKYIDMLQGKCPRQKIGLSYALSQKIEHFCGIEIAPNKYICRMVQPDVQMQAYAFLLDSNGKILSQVFSSEAIHWGIQLSYPAIFQDGYTMQVYPATKKPFLGWELFSTIRSWIRNHTIPLPIYFQEKNIYLPIRLGKQALTWVSSHIDRNRIAINENALSTVKNELFN